MPKKKKPTPQIFRHGESVGCVCVSLAGRDAGTVLVVVGEGEDGYVFVADGKRRRIKAPKMKKTKHISIISKLPPDVCEKISSNTANDSLLRREISRTTDETLS